MPLLQRLRSLPKSVYAIGQLGLLGLPSVLFIPLLLRWVNVDVVATLLVAQVYVYYLVMLQQFGFNLTGPARLSVLGDIADRSILGSTLRFKGVLMLINALGWGTIVYTVFDGASALLVFLMLLLSYMLNSNWYLQSRHDFYTGAFSAGAGVAGGLAILFVIWQFKHHGIELNGVLGWAILAMIAPQVMVGVGSFWRAIGLAISTTRVSRVEHCWPVREIWKQGGPLMVAQLLLLTSATLGTIVVSHMANSDITAAYAATEKIFNLAATVMIALFAVDYPQLALSYRKNHSVYWRQLWVASGRIAAIGLFVFLLVLIAGDWLLQLYLGQDFALLVSSVLGPFAVWLTLVPFQNALQCHFAIVGKTSRLIGVSCLMLLAELVIGGISVTVGPVYWVYGMVAAQLTAALLLIRMYLSEMSESEAN